MEVGWYRPPFSRVVHLYRNGKDQDGEQAPEYRGRTELLKETIGDGKVTLRIRSVRFSDEGGFTCFFRDHSYQEEAAMELKVEGEQCHIMLDISVGWSRPPFETLIISNIR